MLKSFRFLGDSDGSRSSRVMTGSINPRTATRDIAACCWPLRKTRRQASSGAFCCTQLSTRMESEWVRSFARRTQACVCGDSIATLRNDSRGRDERQDHQMRTLWHTSPASRHRSLRRSVEVRDVVHGVFQPCRCRTVSHETKLIGAKGYREASRFQRACRNGAADVSCNPSDVN